MEVPGGEGEATVPQRAPGWSLQGEVWRRSPPAHVRVKRVSGGPLVTTPSQRSPTPRTSSRLHGPTALALASQPPTTSSTATSGERRALRTTPSQRSPTPRTSSRPQGPTALALASQPPTTSRTATRSERRAT